MKGTLTDPAFASYTLTKTACPVLFHKSNSKPPKQQTPSTSSSSTTMALSPPTFTTPPPPTSFTLISFPRPQILLITLNSPKTMNCISTSGHIELDALFTWFDSQPSLSVCILTGSGRAFCAGADLKEWNASNQSGNSERTMPSSGFGGLSRRLGLKPVICAVNGICMGGGCEMIINTDLTIASQSSIFALPEVKIGVIALAGALTRLVRTVGKQRAMEMALSGRTLSAEEAREWGLVNKVVEDGTCVEEAIRMAEMIVGNSPDSVIVSRQGVMMGWEGVGAEEGTRLLADGWYKRMLGGENQIEGVKSFVEKRKPKYVPSKL